eukprot:m.215186 g.215186  ORF g.215186 m.215186 type:complete len:201 (-) comp19085_c0_seq1:914-1516(-)
MEKISGEIESAGVLTGRSIANVIIAILAMKFLIRRSKFVRKALAILWSGMLGIIDVLGGVKMLVEQDKFFSSGKGCQLKFERSENIMRECATGKLPAPIVHLGSTTLDGDGFCRTELSFESPAAEVLHEDAHCVTGELVQSCQQKSLVGATVAVLLPHTGDCGLEHGTGMPNSSSLGHGTRNVLEHPCRPCVASVSSHHV